MKTQLTNYGSLNKLWIYPLIYGAIGAVIGLVLRYFYTGSLSGFPFKNVLHSHSHVMLLGFIFNALLLTICSSFQIEIKGITYKLFLLLQLCVAVFLVAFILQGYALYSIIFSTIHLWAGYFLLIKIWFKLNKDVEQKNLIKLGIVFYFLSSFGPYLLGPLMAMEMKNSPWYQQAIFFYLHFQYFGVFFVWILAVLYSKVKITLSKYQLILLGVSLIFLYTHSLDFSFNYWLINLFGCIGSVGLFLLLINFVKKFSKINHGYKFIYYGIISVAFFNILGSIPSIANLVVENRFLLIAWLHLLFLGIYTPFIWLSMRKISSIIWIIYGMAFLFSETALVFPNFIVSTLNLPLMWSLFASYFVLTLCILIVHVTTIFKVKAWDK